jgi:hypothetical protein
MLILGAYAFITPDTLKEKNMNSHSQEMKAALWEAQIRASTSGFCSWRNLWRFVTATEASALIRFLCSFCEHSSYERSFYQEMFQKSLLNL